MELDGAATARVVELAGAAMARAVELPGAAAATKFNPSWWSDREGPESSYRE